MKKILGLLSLLAVLTTGCQQSKSPLAVASTDDALEIQGMSCKPTSEQTDLSQIKGSGNITGQVNETLTFSLNQKVSCSQAQKVKWTVQGKTVDFGDEAGMVFDNPGTYTVITQVEPKDSAPFQIIQQATVVNENILIVGPSVGNVDQTYDFSLALPTGTTATSVTWNFGDGEAPVTSSDLSLPVKHAYFEPGTYTISAIVSDSSGNKKTITQNFQAVMIVDSNPTCNYSEIVLSGPVEIDAGTSGTYSVTMPECAKNNIKQVKFTFGDDDSEVIGTQAQHTFKVPGQFIISIEFNDANMQEVFSISKQVLVNEAKVEEPQPEPVSCPSLINVKDGQTITKEVACGMSGVKTQSFKELIVEKCSVVNNTIVWTETSKELELVAETECKMQSCEGFGVHGTIKTSQVTGEIKVEKKCEYGEAGIFDIYNQTSDLMCDNGQIISSNVKQSTIKTAGSCPTYQIMPTDKWTTCSADCGGTQTQIYQCQNENGEVASSERCKTAAPVVSRSCDANPEAVKRQEVITTSEEASSCATCPANQIGVVVNKRDVTTTNNYACINHEVAVASTQVQTGPWIKESYCRDLVAFRCSHDSLSNKLAQGRLAWMQKCKSELPVVQEFLSQMEGVKYQNLSASEGKRLLYPTFTVRDTNKTWIAPTNASANCQMPATAYVNAVCVSSCSTPEQEILAQEEANGKMKNITFIDALTQNTKFVATLQSRSSMSSKNVATTKVDQWVTELIDTEHQILKFKMKSGGSLAVTKNHPLLSQDGTMMLAEDFKVGDSLVKLGGIKDEIVSIDEVKYFGKVYNLFVKSNVPQKNVVVTNGYLNGTAFFQNEGGDKMNRDLFRKELYRGAFPRR